MIRAQETVPLLVSIINSLSASACIAERFRLLESLTTLSTEMLCDSVFGGLRHNFVLLWRRFSDQGTYLF